MSEALDLTPEQEEFLDLMRIRMGAIYPAFAGRCFTVKVKHVPEGTPYTYDVRGTCYMNFDHLQEVGVALATNAWFALMLSWLRDHKGRRETRTPNSWEKASLGEMVKDFGGYDQIMIPKSMDLDPEDAKLMKISSGWYTTSEPAETLYTRLPAEPEQPQNFGGSGSGGEPRGFEDDCSDVNEQQQAEADDTERYEVASHVKAQGDALNFMQRIADEILAGRKTSWRDLFRTAVSKAIARVRGHQRNTYRRSNRHRSYADGLIAPSKLASEPKIAIVIDTSGSMSQADLSAALKEVDTILKELHAPVSVIAVDACVHSVQQNVTSASTIKLSGFGGTDMRVGISQAMETTPKPNIVIVLTDGYTPWPDKPVAGAAVIAGIIGDCNDKPPAFIKTISIPVGDL